MSAVTSKLGYSGELTFAFVDQQAAGSAEVDGVVELEALQVLAHLPALGKFGIDIFEVHLVRGPQNLS